MLTSKSLSVASGKCKRPDEIKEYFSRKMTWLTEKLGKVSDDEFAVLYALVVKYLSNGSEWCRPTDKTLGEACGKSERSIRG